MPATLLSRRLGRSDSDSSQDSRKQVSFDRSVRIKPIGGKYTSNGSGVTRVNLNGSTSPSTSPVRRLHDDILVNRFGKLEDENEIEYVTPKVNNRYVIEETKAGDVKGGNESKSYSRLRNGGESWKTHPGHEPDTPPGQRRNHVWNIVNQFDRESKQKYVCQVSDEDDCSFSLRPDGTTNGHLEMNKSKKNPIANGIKVIFGLKNLRKSESAEKAKFNTTESNNNLRSRRDREENAKNKRLHSSISELSVDSSKRGGDRTSGAGDRSKRHGDRLGLLKTATENRRREKSADEQSEMTNRALSPDQDVTDGYSTSKTFEYYDNKGLDNYDSIRDYYLNRYRDPHDSRIGSPDSDFRDDDKKPPTPPRNANMFRSTGNISTQKTRLANGASEYVFRSGEALSRSAAANQQSGYQRTSEVSDTAKKRDLYKSTGDLEYRSRPLNYGSHGGSQPEINRKQTSPIRGYSDDERSTSPKERYTDRSRGYVSTILEDDVDRRSLYRDGSIEREGEALPREVRSPDSRFSTLERMRRAPSYDFDTRSFGTLESNRNNSRMSIDDQKSGRAFSPDSIASRRHRYGSTSSIDSSHDKVRSWERRAKNRGRIQRVFTADEPTYSTIDKNNKMNRKLDYSKENLAKERFVGVHQQGKAQYKSDIRSSSHQAVDNEGSLRRNVSKKQGYDTTGRYDTDFKSSKREARTYKEESREKDVDRSRALERVDKSDRDRSSSRESIQQHVESSHQKQVFKDDDGFQQTIEEDKYNDVTMERVDQDSDTEEVVDVTNDAKTEEYEKDGHYHKHHKQSKKETKTTTYTRPDVVETLRRLSKPVDGNKRISDRPYNEDIYGRPRQVDVHNKHARDLADVKTSIEKSTSENRFREGSRDIYDKLALNRAVVETGTIDRQNTKDGHRDVIIRDQNDYNRRIDNRSTYDDSDPMRKLRTNATVDKVDHYRTVDERHVVERMEKKPPSLERSRQQLKQIEAPDKPPRGSKSGKSFTSISDKLKAKREKDGRDSLRKENKDVDVVYTKVKKSSKNRTNNSNRKWSGEHSSDEENHDKIYERAHQTNRKYSEKKYREVDDRQASYEDLQRAVGGTHESGRYRDLTKTRHVSGEIVSDADLRRSNQNVSTGRLEKKTMEKTYHEPVQANIEKTSTNGWVTRRKETYLAGDSSSPSPPLHKRQSTLEKSKLKNRLFGSKKDMREQEISSKKPVSRTASSVTDKKEEPTFHHFKQYKGKHGPTYPSIRITLSGKENSDGSDGQNTTRSNKYQRSKLPGNMHMRNGSVDRLDVPSPNGYHSSTLQHTKKNKGVAVKRSNSSAATMPPVQRLRNNRGVSPLRTKNNTSSSADSVAGESTTSSKRAVGFYIPAVNHSNKKSTEDLTGSNSALGVSRTQSMLSSKPGMTKKYREKTTTYALAHPQGDQVDKDDEIYGSTHVIDYSRIEEEDETEKKKDSSGYVQVKSNKDKNKKLKRTTSLPKDTRFPWLFRKKKKEKMRVVNE